MQHGADNGPSSGNLKLTDGVFMVAGAFLDDGYGAADATLRLEVTHEDDVIGDVGNIDGSVHVSDEPMLGDGDKRRDAVSIEVLEQLVEVQGERVFLRHRHAKAHDVVRE